MILTAIFEPSDEGGYTCWLEEMPEVISEGDSLEDAEKNLMDALDLMLTYRREKAENELYATKTHYTKRTFSLAMA